MTGLGDSVSGTTAHGCRYLALALICFVLSACGGSGGPDASAASGSGNSASGSIGSSGGIAGSSPPTALSCAGYPTSVPITVDGSTESFVQACVIVQAVAQPTPSFTVTTLTGNLTGHGQDNLQSFVVYARIIAQAADQATALALAQSVAINTANGNVLATPDQATAPQSLTIDFEVFTAPATNLTLTDSTGNLAADNYDAILNLTTATGNVVLNSVQGQETVNADTGAIDISFTETSFVGEGMTAKTKTGNVTVSCPVGFQAAFTAETSIGVANIDGETQKAPVPNSPAVVTSGTGAPILLQTNTGNVTVTS